MEQKRTLWVIAASGVFLLVVVGAAVILYSPSVNKSQVAQASVNPNTGWTSPVASASSVTDPFGLSSPSTAPATSAAPANPFENAVQPAESAAVDSYAGYSSPSSAGQSPIQTGNVTVIADNTTVVGTGTTTIDLNALKTTSAVSPNVTARNAVTQAQIAETQNSYELRTEQRDASRAVASAPVYNYEPESVAPAPKASAPKAAASVKPAAKPAASTAKKSSAVAKAAAPAAKIADKFWVQAASYSTKKSADEARSTLESNKIPSEVFTYTDAKGKVFYRVRVGPYTTSSEAEYWKTQVAKIDRFADSQSYVVNSSAKKTN